MQLKKNQNNVKQTTNRQKTLKQYGFNAIIMAKPSIISSNKNKNKNQRMNKEINMHEKKMYFRIISRFKSEMYKKYLSSLSRLTSVQHIHNITK